MSSLPYDPANRPGLAAAMALSGMFLLGFTDNFLRVVAEEAGLWQFHAMRAGFVIPMLLLAIRVVGARLRPRRLSAVVARSVTMGLAMLCYFGAIALMPIGVAVAGFFTAPIFVLILSATVLGRRVGPWRWLAAAVGFLGILMVMRPDPAALEMAMAVPFVAGFLYACAALMTRELCEGENALVLTLGAFTAMCLMGLAGMAVLAVVPALQGSGFFVQPAVVPSGRVVAVVAMQAVGAMAGVGLLVRAYQLGEATHVAIFEYSLMVFAAFWAWVLFAEPSDAPAVAGMALIAASGAVIAIRSGSPQASRAVTYPG